MVSNNICLPSHNIRFNRGRRLKAFLVVLLVWSVVSLLRYLPEAQWFIVGLTAILTLQTLKMLMAKTLVEERSNDDYFPTVTILVAAKNESEVLPQLVYSLFELNYPASHLDIWIVDDGSSDETPQRLQELQKKFPGLQVHRRESKGGKSGALNGVFPFTRGEIILICDADAQLPANFLQHTVPLFQNNTVGAVQVRKVITNSEVNFVTRCQQLEMNCDCFLQIHRIAAGGMAELRGNGMLVRRTLLEKCNGWNEDWKYYKKLVFKNLSLEIQSRIKPKIKALAIEPRPDGVKKLKGKENSYRIRIGDYRVVYEIFDDILVVKVVEIGHRSDIYQQQ
jgi:1,2-diacylglycerol 3-beta-glucosyltransferase